MQKFNPDKVMVSDTLNKEVADAGFTSAFQEKLVTTSLLSKLGKRVDVDGRVTKMSRGLDELSDAYFVGEGEKIGVAKLEGDDFYFETKKIGVIIPVTEEFLAYTWSNFFAEVVASITDKFNKKVDGAAFLGLHGDPFKTIDKEGRTVQGNVLSAAEEAGKVLTGDLTTENIYDLEALLDAEPNAFVGHRTLHRKLRALRDGQIKLDNGMTIGGETIFTRPTDQIGRLDDLAYGEIKLGKDNKRQPIPYPDGTLLTGNFDNLFYGIPRGANLRLSVSDQATISGVQNAGPDSGDVHLFEQDMKALRAIFEIGVAVPKNEEFAVLKPATTAGEG
ncbi:phage major capsid protein [Aerococcus urinae]|uniref:phage major capsid protein n=1 Tax=Aerococcus urinae TaxID=1376 RepID=UPI00254BEF7A|nr:phage major capsid protein [Aerococcus urinae]MDK6688321.1 phage major capsid protein [Aerococcus urinae]